MQYKNPQTIVEKVSCIHCGAKKVKELRYYREDIVFSLCLFIGFGAFIVGAVLGSA